MVTRRKQLLLQRVCRQHVASCMSGDLRFVSSSAASAAAQEAGMVFIRRSRQTVVSHAGRIDVFGFFFFFQKRINKKGKNCKKKTFFVKKNVSCTEQFVFAASKSSSHTIFFKAMAD